MQSTNFSKSITQDYKRARKNKISKASTLSKTEIWKLASDYFTFFGYGDKELVMDLTRKHLKDTDFHKEDFKIS